MIEEIENSSVDEKTKQERKFVVSVVTRASDFMVTKILDPELDHIESSYKKDLKDMKICYAKSLEKRNRNSKDWIAIIISLTVGVGGLLIGILKLS